MSEQAEGALPGQARVAELENDARRGARFYSDVAPEEPGLKKAADSQPASRKQAPIKAAEIEPPAPAANSMRSDGDATKKRRAVPPLEDRFNVKRIGLIEKEYHFRDQAGKVAFTDKLLSIGSASESPAAVKAMVDRAAERGWKTVRLSGSPEFVRQGWVAASAQGLKAVGHTPTPGDREAAAKERTRLDVSQEAPAPQCLAATVLQVQSAHSARVGHERSEADSIAKRQLATAIEKALVEGKVAPELRGQVRAMLAAEGATRVATGERFKVPVYDARAPRARNKTVQPNPQRLGDRERSR